MIIIKFESIYIKRLENGYIVDIHNPDPKAKEKWDTIDKEYFCGSKEEVVNKIDEAFDETT